jgi:predicted  nucleic acid-binding Zn-ribbon protein
MEFRDYAAKETAALFSRLLASQAEASLQHVRFLREALDAASKGIEEGATATADADADVQELIRRLNTAAGTAAKVAAQKVQKESQVAIDAVQADLDAERAQSSRLSDQLSALQADAEHLKDQLAKETERADSADRDLDAAIEAHAHVDAARVEAEADAKKQASARAALEHDLAESRGLLDATVADAARLSGELDTARAELADVRSELDRTRADAESSRNELESHLSRVNEELQGERERVQQLSTSLTEVQAQADILLADFAEAETQADALRRDAAEAQSQIEVLRGELADARSRADGLSHDLEGARGHVEGLKQELADVLTQSDALRADLQREIERAEAADRDLDAAIEAHANVDASRVEAEAEAKRAAAALTTAEKSVVELRGLLDASVAQAGRLTMQLDATVAENGVLSADLIAAQAELDAARTQREAVAAQLDASRARIQTLERNLGTQEDQLRALERALDEATIANDVLKAEAESRASDDGEDSIRAIETGALRDDLVRMGTLLDNSTQAVDELAEKASVTDLFAALVRHLASEFTRVALFRVKANRLEGEDQIGFDDTTDVTKLVLPLNLDSLITRAANSGTFEQLTGEELTESSRAPFGGTPTVALAMPLAFQGETLAVVYADSDLPIADRGPAGHEASVGYARLLVRTASVLLMRLSQELKTLNELRDYAAMLLQEAQEMYSADLEAAKSDDERRSRLKDTIECARQLYAQRAALEGAAAALLFDDRIATAIDADPSAPFARDLSAIAGASDGQRRAAEAS